MVGGEEQAMKCKTCKEWNDLCHACQRTRAELAETEAERWKQGMEAYQEIAAGVQQDCDRAMSVARRLFHDWSVVRDSEAGNSRTVRSRQEIAEENPWILDGFSAEVSISTETGYFDSDQSPNKS